MVVFVIIVLLSKKKCLGSNLEENEEVVETQAFHRRFFTFGHLATSNRNYLKGRRT